MCPGPSTQSLACAIHMAPRAQSFRRSNLGVGMSARWPRHMILFMRSIRKIALRRGCMCVVVPLRRIPLVFIACVCVAFRDITIPYLYNPRDRGAGDRPVRRRRIIIIINYYHFARFKMKVFAAIRVKQRTRKLAQTEPGRHTSVIPLANAPRASSPQPLHAVLAAHVTPRWRG